MNQELRRPEEIFDGDHLPDDLKWVMAHFGLPKQDPFVVMLAWHWHRVQNAKDTLQGAQQEIERTLDAKLLRLEQLTARSEALGEHLKKLETLLSDNPARLAKQWEDKLSASAQGNITTANKLSETLNTLLPTTEKALKRLHFHQMLAVFFSGLSAGWLLSLWIYSHWFTRS